MIRKTRKHEVQGRRKRPSSGSTASPKSSAAVIHFLRRLGYKQVEIADLLGKSASFVSLVKRGKRFLCLEDVDKLAEEIGVPAFWIHLETTDNAEVPADFRKLHQSARFFFHTRLTPIIAKKVI